MAVSFTNPISDHCDKYIGEPGIIYCLVARQMEMSEVEIVPAANKAMDSEWKELADMKCWEAATVH